MVITSNEFKEHFNRWADEMDTIAKCHGPCEMFPERHDDKIKPFEVMSKIFRELAKIEVPFCDLHKEIQRILDIAKC